MNKHKIKKILSIIGIAVVVVVGLIVWYYAHYAFGLELRLGKTPELIAMEKSASQIQLTSGREIARRQNDFHHALGEPVYAGIMLDYAPISNYTKSDVFEEITQDLSYSFKQDRLEIKRFGYYHAILPLNKFNVVVSVTNIEDENVVRVYFSTVLPATPQTPT